MHRARAPRRSASSAGGRSRRAAAARRRARHAAESRRTAPAAAASGAGTASAAAPARAPSPATRATGSDSCGSGRSTTRQPRRIIRQAATGESMPPESRQATRPLTPVGSPPAPALLAEEVERLVRERLDVDRQLRVPEVDVPAARHLDAAADLALDLRRRQRKTLVGAARRHPERRRDRSGPRSPRIAAAIASTSSGVAAGPGEVRDAEDARRRVRGPASQSAAGSEHDLDPPISARTSRTPRPRVAARRLRTSRAMNHGRFFPLSAIS